MVIREIQISDNPKIRKVIQSTFLELQLPLEGTAYSDPDLFHMYESYQQSNAIYYIVEQNGIVTGGAGIKPLELNNNEVCELQKMYFSPHIRRLGYGKLILKYCLDFAQSAGYKYCYLETISNLTNAINLYKINDFKNLSKPMGSTGHCSCDVWMIKAL